MKIFSFFTNNTILMLGAFLLMSLRMSIALNIEQSVFESDTYMVRPASSNSMYDAVPYEPLFELVDAYLKYSPDPITSLYNERITRELVRDFFIAKTGSESIANTILFHADNENVPIGIVFSLAFVESSFRPSVANVNKDASRDLGLFQLNTKTFRYMKREDFFHLDTNVKAGVGYLKYAFSLDPDPKIALAIYNAGPSRPLRGIIPDVTQKHREKVFTYLEKLNREFDYYIRKRFASVIASEYPRAESAEL